MIYVIRNSLVVLVVLLSALGWACVRGQNTSDGGTPALHGEPYVQTVLVFGLSGPGGKAVSEREWQYFVDSYVTPRYSQGLTVIDSDGQWMMESGKVIREDSKVLILLYERQGQEENDESINFIIDTYKKMFRQEAVLRIDTAAGVSF